MTSTLYNALALSIKAFEKVKGTSAKKRETLALCFEQVKPILKRYMKENNIPLIEVNLKTREALVVEPIPNSIRQINVNQWLSGRLSTEKLEMWLKAKYQNTRYPNFAMFLEGVEAWLLERKGKVASHG